MFGDLGIFGDLVTDLTGEFSLKIMSYSQHVSHLELKWFDDPKIRLDDRSLRKERQGPAGTNLYFIKICNKSPGKDKVSIAWCFCDQKDGMKYIAVNPSWRRKGLGKFLYVFVTEKITGGILIQPDCLTTLGNELFTKVRASYPAPGLGLGLTLNLRASYPAPRADNTSAAPLFEETALLPCFATGTPDPAITKVVAVEISGGWK